MISIEIPGRDSFSIEHIVLGYNGILATDGLLDFDAALMVRRLNKVATIAILTTDTYGTAEAQCKELGIELVTCPEGGVTQFKEDYVKALDGQVACIGNGFNDVGMLKEATLGIAVMGSEGAYAGLLQHADIAVGSSQEALGLLVRPDRVRATLRD